MGELVRMPNATIMSPTEDVDPLHPQAQVLMVIHGDVHMTMSPPASEHPSPTAELDITIEAEKPEPFRRKDRRPEIRPTRWSWRSLLRRGQHRKGSRA